MSLSQKVKTALDENRLLILGAQLLFGFQFNGAFQELFSTLSPATRIIDGVALFLMMLTIGLLIAPSMQHRIVDKGANTQRIHDVAGRCAGMALYPFGISLGLDIYIVFHHKLGFYFAIAAGFAFCALAAVLWIGLGVAVRAPMKAASETENEEPTPLAKRIEQMLTEARVVLPGAQAVLGFQFTVMFMRAFDELSAIPQIVHFVALCAVAITVVLLMTPAALHRVGFGGEESERFLQLGSGFVIAAPGMLAIGLAADIYVAIERATGASEAAGAVGITSLIVLLGMWFALPLALQRRGSA
jgi:hypothetical protein